VGIIGFSRMIVESPENSVACRNIEEAAGDCRTLFFMESLGVLRSV
jgi:hypothetical protein